MYKYIYLLNITKVNKLLWMEKKF